MIGLPEVHFRPDEAADPLGEVLHLLRLNGTLYCRAELHAPWGINMPAMDGAMLFIILTEGEGWMRIAGEAPRLIGQGSLVLLPHGTPVTLSSDPKTTAVSLFDLPATRISERYEIMSINGEGPVTRAMTGVVAFDGVAAQRLTVLMPNVLVSRGWDGAAGQWLSSTLDLIAHEAAKLKPGGETMITRLADILIIQAIREWLDTAPEAQTGWLAALRDRQLGRAIAAMHRSPDSRLTLEALAGIAGMSRSSFAARFTASVGMSAIRYLAEWRLHKARLAIVESREAIGLIAKQAGYQSEAAFGRAFKQLFGTAPGALRRAS